MAGPKAQPRETVEAKEAFAAYVSLGYGRSLQKLADLRVSQGLAKNSASALVLAKRWSSQHKWQGRIEQAATERAERLLREAGELDADTFLISSRHLHKQVNDFANYPDTVIKIRESVRRPAPKGGISVTGGEGAPLTIQIIERQDGPQ